MSGAYIQVWVHCRHADHPEVAPGLQCVPVPVAAALIEAGCAQDWQTDSRRLHPVDPDKVVGAALESEPESELPSPPSRKKPAAVTARAPPRRYKRRDMRPES